MLIFLFPLAPERLVLKCYSDATTFESLTGQEDDASGKLSEAITPLTVRPFSDNTLDVRHRPPCQKGSRRVYELGGGAQVQ